MYLLGIELGSSQVKASLIEAEGGKDMENSFSPPKTMKIAVTNPGWAEQNPENWWTNLSRAVREVVNDSGIDSLDIKAIGISYQMHGLVMINKDKELVYPSIIWCDSRATSIGKQACKGIGGDYCMTHLLNSPGNFTASKLKWMQDNHPVIYKEIDKILLPGDYINMRLTGQVNTTIGGLSEGVFWDFQRHELSESLFTYYNIDKAIIPEVVPNFSNQGELLPDVAEELGLIEGTPITYRSGDQPNNAFSLNVLNPGQLASTSGNSGVIYGVTDELISDRTARINTFAHVNHSQHVPRLGLLLCINGTGQMNTWLKEQVAGGKLYPDELKRIDMEIPVGANGLVLFPFGNGAERILNDRNLNAQVHGLQFNNHSKFHLFRAAHESVAFSMNYGLEIMRELHDDDNTIRAYKANMFLSPVFRKTLANVSGATIEYYNTDGAKGAARGAGIGAGIYFSEEEAFEGLHKIEETTPDVKSRQIYLDAYHHWKEILTQQLDQLDNI